MPIIKNMKNIYQFVRGQVKNLTLIKYRWIWAIIHMKFKQLFYYHNISPSATKLAAWQLSPDSNTQHNLTELITIAKSAHEMSRTNRKHAKRGERVSEGRFVSCHNRCASWRQQRHGRDGTLLRMIAVINSVSAACYPWRMVFETGWGCGQRGSLATVGAATYRMPTVHI